MSAARTLRRSWTPVARAIEWQIQRNSVPPMRHMIIVSDANLLLPNVALDRTLGRQWSIVTGTVRGSWSSAFSSPQIRLASSQSSAVVKHEEDDQKEAQNVRETKEKAAEMVVSQYWGVTSKSYFREDGTKWPWNCFRPSDTYTPDHNIDLTKHHVPLTFEEKVSLQFVKLIKIPVNMFFRTRYGCRAMMLETVAAVPGMVGGMLLHLRSLRRFEQSGGWIKALLDEAENERMHLMSLMEVVKPVWYERALVVLVQGIFFNCYFVFYLLSPRMAHRFTGYLEEEAILSYTHFLGEIDRGNVENVPAPAIAIDYWRLPKNARLRDVIIALRADEAHHRDVNHYASDIRMEGKQLHESPAPVDYH